MPEPSVGQPFMVYPGLRISVGDMKAQFGTDAGMGVIILNGGVPTSYIITPNDTFTVQAQMRAALGGAPFPLPASLVTRFYIQDLITGVQIPGSPFIGGSPMVLPAPIGDHGRDGVFDVVTWYSIDSPVVPPLPIGVYKISVIGSGGSVMFPHADTILQVA
jgi:hypothetical protein